MPFVGYPGGGVRETSSAENLFNAGSMKYKSFTGKTAGSWTGLSGLSGRSGHGYPSSMMSGASRTGMGSYGAVSWGDAPAPGMMDRARGYYKQGMRGARRGMLKAGYGMASKMGSWGGGMRKFTRMAAARPLMSMGIAGAGLIGAGRVAFGDGTVGGTLGYGVAGGMMGAAGGAAYSMGRNALAGALPSAARGVASNTGKMAAKLGARGAAAGLLIGSLLSGNSAPNGFRGLHR